MQPSKRSRRSFAPDADSLLAIRLAEEGGGAPLAVDRHLLLAASECARGLPPDAASWDLSSLLVDGQPVRREVVVAWLHAVTQLNYSQPFSGAPQQEPPLATSAAGLAQLLAFADAVGASAGVLKACLPQPLEQLRFRVAVGGGRELELRPGAVYDWAGLKLRWRGFGEKAYSPQIAVLPSEEAKAALVQQFASQLEALLYLAHQLELDSLVALLHRCVRFNTVFDDSLLRCFDRHFDDDDDDDESDESVVDPRVMSARVLEAAVGPQAGQQVQAAYINSIVTQPCSFAEGRGLRYALKPLDLTDEQQRCIWFKAECVSDELLGGGSMGERVDVMLDLFEGMLTIDGETHKVQLLVGPRVGGRHLDALHAAHAQAAAAPAAAADDARVEG